MSDPQPFSPPRSTLPTELRERVVDWLVDLMYGPDQWRDLDSCAVAHRTFTSRAQYHRFKTLEIRDEQRCDQLVSILTTSPHLIQKIQCISVPFKKKCLDILSGVKLTALGAISFHESPRDTESVDSKTLRFATEIMANAPSLQAIELYLDPTNAHHIIRNRPSTVHDIRLLDILNRVRTTVPPTLSFVQDRSARQITHLELGTRSEGFDWVVDEVILAHNVDRTGNLTSLIWWNRRANKLGRKVFLSSTGSIRSLQCSAGHLEGIEFPVMPKLEYLDIHATDEANLCAKKIAELFRLASNNGQNKLNTLIYRADVDFEPDGPLDFPPTMKDEFTYFDNAVAGCHFPALRKIEIVVWQVFDYTLKHGPHSFQNLTQKSVRDLFPMLTALKVPGSERSVMEWSFGQIK